MIYHVKGNLLTSDVDVIAHQSNCKMGFGAGIAGQIRTMYPEAYRAFIRDERSSEYKLGKLTLAESNNKVIFNLYGQNNYGGEPGVVYTDYEALKSAIKIMQGSIKYLFKDQEQPKIGMPFKIGCGLAGGDWEGVVLPMLEELFKDGELYLYEYTP